MSELKPCPQEAEALDIIESLLDVADMKCTGPLYADDPPRSGMCHIPEEDAAILRHYIAHRRAQPSNKEKGKYAMDTESKRIFDDLYALHDHYDEDPQHMICAEAADYIKSLSEMLERSVQPSNEPLTLEQLREMQRSGEGIYVCNLYGVPILRGKQYTAAVLDRVAAFGAMGYHLQAIYGRGLTLAEDDYGKTWFAYTRKPEGSENDAV